MEQVGKYIFGTGLISVIISGFSLVRAIREETFTWRTALSWLSWGITVALMIGAIVDIRRIDAGKPVPADSPVADRAPSPKRR